MIFLSLSVSPKLVICKKQKLWQLAVLFLFMLTLAATLRITKKTYKQALKKSHSHVLKKSGNFYS